MSRRLSASQALWGARDLASKHGMYISEVLDKGQPAWRLYRKASPKNVFIAQRTDRHDMLKLVQNTTAQPA